MPATICFLEPADDVAQVVDAPGDGRQFGVDIKLSQPTIRWPGRAALHAWIGTVRQFRTAVGALHRLPLSQPGSGSPRRSPSPAMSVSRRAISASYRSRSILVYRASSSMLLLTFCM